jgi:hypothetical protein
MEAIFSSETSVEFQGNTRHYIPDSTLHNHRCANLKFYKRSDVVNESSDVHVDMYSKGCTLDQ